MTTPIFAIRDLSVQFGGLRALDRFSMDVAPGSIHALIGPNGAGKSTVFNCISKFYRPVSGDLLFEGHSILNVGASQLAGLGIARTFQNVELCRGLTVLENVLIGMMPRVARYNPFMPGRLRSSVESKAIADAEQLLDQNDLLSYRNVRADELDFGHQKKLDLLRAIASKPRLLLLDEPAAGLRNREIDALDQLLVGLARSRGVTILLVEHVMQLVMKVADTITVLNQGQKIAEGQPAEIRVNPIVIEAYLGRGHDAAP